MAQAVTNAGNLAAQLRGRHDSWHSSCLSIGLVLTKRCPVGCRHCIIDCTAASSKSPDRKTQYDWVAKIAEAGVFRAVNITGGEPFFEFPHLLGITAAITDHGLHPTVITSAYWAGQEEATRDKIEQLADAGLYALSVSVDVFHQERIPIENVARAVRISKEYDLRAGISLTYFHGYEDPHRLIRELEKDLGDSLDDVDVVSGGIVRAGRAQNLLPPTGPQPAGKTDKICTAIGPIILENGDVACCCGAELPEDSILLIGNVDRDSLTEIYHRFRRHPLVHFVHTLGLAEMVGQLRAVGLGEDLEVYKNAPEAWICELCLKMLSRDENVEFFRSRFRDPDVRRDIGLRALVMYGDPSLLSEMEESNGDQDCACT
jgi:pyruvate-formate lyase-activating enzyme